MKMGRQRGKKEERGNTPRWVSLFTSLMIILLTFFILLNNYAEMDDTRVRKALVSIHETFGFFRKGKQSLPLVGAMDSDMLQAVNEKMKKSRNLEEGEEGEEGEGKEKREELVKEIEALVEEKELEGIEWKISWQGVVITLKDQLFFDSGSAVIHPAVVPILEELGDLILSFPYRVEIGGHADSRPLRGGVYKSNWELSVARAMNVLKIFAEKKSIPPGRLQAAGFGEYSPIAPNDTPMGRAANRRVEIVFLVPDEPSEEK